MLLVQNNEALYGVVEHVELYPPPTHGRSRATALTQSLPNGVMTSGLRTEVCLLAWRPGGLAQPRLSILLPGQS